MWADSLQCPRGGSRSDRCCSTLSSLWAGDPSSASPGLWWASAGCTQLLQLCYKGNLHIFFFFLQMEPKTDMLKFLSFYTRDEKRFQSFDKTILSCFTGLFWDESASHGCQSLPWTWKSTQGKKRYLDICVRPFVSKGHVQVHHLCVMCVPGDE